MSAENFKFTPKPIDTVCIRAGEGTNIQVAIGTIQRIAALRAYSNYGNCQDWMERLSSAYVVALATRSADQLLMQHIQNELNNHLSIDCRDCRNASIGLSLIRERVFPTLKLLREHANTLIHHLDDPVNQGVADVNIEGVFDYCHHLFNEHVEALFGAITIPHGKFSFVRCKSCRK